MRAHADVHAAPWHSAPAGRRPVLAARPGASTAAVSNDVDVPELDGPSELALAPEAPVDPGHPHRGRLQHRARHRDVLRTENGAARGRSGHLLHDRRRGRADRRHRQLPGVRRAGLGRHRAHRRAGHRPGRLRGAAAHRRHREPDGAHRGAADRDDCQRRRLPDACGSSCAPRSRGSSRRPPRATPPPAVLQLRRSRPPSVGPYRDPTRRSCSRPTSCDPDGTIVRYEWYFGDGSRRPTLPTRPTSTAARDLHGDPPVTDDDGAPGGCSADLLIAP